METNTEDVTINRLKRQFDSATRVVEAVAAGSIKAGEAQLRAAADAQKAIESARKMIAGTTDPRELWRIQSEWIATGVQRSLAFWSELNQAAAETQTTVTRYLYDPAAAFVPQANVLPEASKTAFGLFDDAYRRWRETTLQFWGATRQLAQDAEDAVNADAQAETHRSRRNGDHTGARKSRHDA